MEVVGWGVNMNWMMRDYTFCDLKTCKRKDTCRRYEEEHELGDSVFMWPKDFDPDACEMYWKEEK